MNNSAGNRLTVVVAADDPQRRRELDELARAAFHPYLDIIAGPSAAFDSSALPPAGEARVALAIVHAAAAAQAAAVDALRSAPAAQRPRLVVLGASDAAADAALPQDVAPQRLRQVLREQLTCFATQSTPELVESLAPVLDVQQLASAFAQADSSRRRSESELRSARRGFLAARELSDEAVEQAMRQIMERRLSHLPRLNLPAGSILLEEDKPVNGLWIVLSGQVDLTRRGVHREVLFHSRTTGPIVGLLALAQRRHAFFTCRATTDVQAIPVTWEQLDEALQSDPTLSLHFLTVLVRSMSNRLRRIAELQLEVDQLNSALASERDQLAEALRQLKGAQGRLVHSEKMATLGELSAGVAHELNNPITAIRRSTDHLSEDLPRLVAQLDDGAALTDWLASTLQSAPISTAELRNRRRDLVAAVRDEPLAARLLNIGLTTPEQYHAKLGNLSRSARELRLERMEQVHQIGVSLRSLRTSSDRVAAIVRSLRSYARPEETLTPNVDIHDGIEDTLLLFGSRLRGIEVVREYGQLPHIECRPGELNQVWTNLIANALDAMEGRGRLVIRTRPADDQGVCVEVIDSGHGIPSENLPRVFELNFTTKRGKTRFGLGMGLLICKQILDRHGGSIRIESAPGRTRVIVQLPVQPPALPGELTSMSEERGTQ